MTWPVTGLGPAGTPRRPNPPTTTWPSSSAGSSSPPDFAVHALSRPPRKKPEPSSQPGQPPGLDQQKLRNTRDPRSRTMQFYLNGYQPGDPFIQDPHPSVAQRPDGLPDEVDVLII